MTIVNRWRRLMASCGMIGCLIGGGCATTRTEGESGQPADSALSGEGEREGQFTVTPIFPVRGRVVSVNPEARFVVVEFPPNRMPEKGEKLSVFRQGAKVGEVWVSDPRLDGYVTADIGSGGVQKGDVVRRE